MTDVSSNLIDSLGRDFQPDLSQLGQPNGNSSAAHGRHSRAYDREADDDMDMPSRAPGDGGVVERCLDVAGQVASGLNHAVLTFEHLVLAFTHVAEAREKLGERQELDIGGIRATALRKLTEIGEGAGDSLPKSAELTEIMNRADLFAQARRRDHQSKQPISVKDVLDAVLELDEHTPARLLLSGRIPESIVAHVDSGFATLHTRLDELGQMNLLLVNHIVKIDGMIETKLAELRLLAASSHTALTVPHISEQFQRVLSAPGMLARPAGLLHGAVAGVIGISLLAAGYALGSSGVGPKIMSFIGRFIV